MKSDTSLEKKMPGGRRGNFRNFFLTVGGSLLLLTGIFYVRHHNLPVGIIVVVGGIGGFLFVLGLLWRAPPPLTAEEQQNRAVRPGEGVLRSGPANQQRGWENRGGFLNLTSQRLVFFSHGLNMQNADVVLLLTNIARIERARTLGIIPNAFQIVMVDGLRYRFTVFSPQAWIEAIQAARSSNLMAGNNEDKS